MFNIKKLKHNLTHLLHLYYMYKNCKTTIKALIKKSFKKTWYLMKNVVKLNCNFFDFKKVTLCIESLKLLFHTHTKQSLDYSSKKKMYK